MTMIPLDPGTLFVGGASVLLVGCIALVGTAVIRGRGGRKVETAAYSAKPILNKSESKLYWMLERWRRENAKDLVLSTQVAYGSFLTTKNLADWNRVAAKHADFVFWGRDNYVKLIIEFDGAGHYGSNRNAAENARRRDEIKNAAAIAAGIPLVRVPQSATADELRKILEVVLCPEQQPIVVKGARDAVTAFSDERQMGTKK